MIDVAGFMLISSDAIACSQLKDFFSCVGRRVAKIFHSHLANRDAFVLLGDNLISGNGSSAAVLW